MVSNLDLNIDSQNVNYNLHPEENKQNNMYPPCSQYYYEAPTPNAIKQKHAKTVKH